MSNDWKIGLCQGDVCPCCLGCWCPCVIYSRLLAKAHLLGDTSQCCACLTYIPCSVCVTLELRQTIRDVRKIKPPDSQVADCCTVCCCTGCAYRQMTKEVESMASITEVITEAPKAIGRFFGKKK